MEEEKKPEQKESQEDIIEEIIDENHNNFGGKDDLEGIGASNNSMGIDQSIDTLRMEEYDYIEEIKWIKAIKHSYSTFYSTFIAFKLKLKDRSL